MTDEGQKRTWMGVTRLKEGGIVEGMSEIERRKEEGKKEEGKKEREGGRREKRQGENNRRTLV